MGKGDVAIKKYLSEKERFADLWNAILFNGKQIICAEQLEAVPNESDLIIKDKSGKEKYIQRYRDIIMQWKGKINLVLLALESQEKVHYRMPIRNMLYDSLSYIEQMDKMWREHEKAGDKYTEEEFLSRFMKQDRLIPVFTIVFYYGEDPWDGNTSLHQMLNVSKDEKEKEILTKYIPDYHINLIDASRMENFKVLRTDLQLIFGMLQYKNQKDKLLGYINQHKEYFEKLDIDTYYAVQVFLNSKEQLKRIMTEDSGKESINMCKALEELYADGIEAGKNAIIQNMIKCGIPDEKISILAECDQKTIDDVRKLWVEQN